MEIFLLWTIRWHNRWVSCTWMLKIQGVSKIWSSRKKICNARLKRLKAKLRKVLRSKKEQEKLKILVEASLAQHSTWHRSLMPNFKKFGKLFDIFEFFMEKIGFSGRCVAPPGTRFWWGPPFKENLAFLDLTWKNMHAHKWPRNFDRFWASKKVKNTSKMTFLPLFGHTGSGVGKTHFWKDQIQKFHLF